MPYKMRKVKGDGYRVSGPHGTKAKGTSKKNAEGQMRLLRALENNPNFKPRKRRR